MHLSKNLESFRNGNLELWCPKIIVRQQVNDKPIEHVGSGVIRQDQNRRLEFVLIEGPFVSRLENIRHIMSNSKKVGVLLPVDAYYSFEAHDISGCKWKTERLQVSNQFSQAGSITKGGIYILDHLDFAISQKNTIKLEIFSDVQLPLTKVTKKTICRGKDKSIIWENNSARFKFGKFEFKIFQENGILTVVAASNNSNFPDNFETRILEALQFVTARSLTWGILQKTSGGKSMTCLRSPDAVRPTCQMSLPIDYLQYNLAGKSAWMLFKKYLGHISGFKGTDRLQTHPLSSWLHFARNTSLGSIFTKGLGLGIAVEGILESTYSGLGKPSSKYVKAVEKMIEHIKSFSGDKNVLDRTLGALRNMKSVRPKDKLLALRAKGVVRADDVNAWDIIRNSGAHARPPERENLQEWIDYCFRTEVLIYHLIFRAIGFKGFFTDYGNKIQDWPLSQYPL